MQCACLGCHRVRARDSTTIPTLRFYRVPVYLRYRHTVAMGTAPSILVSMSDISTRNAGLRVPFINSRAWSSVCHHHIAGVLFAGAHLASLASLRALPLVIDDHSLFSERRSVFCGRARLPSLQSFRPASRLGDDQALGNGRRTVAFGRAYQQHADGAMPRVAPIVSVILPLVVPSVCPRGCQCPVVFAREAHNRVSTCDFGPVSAVAQCAACNFDVAIDVCYPSATAAAAAIPPVGSVEFYRWSIISETVGDSASLTVRLGERELFTFPRSLGDYLRFMARRVWSRRFPRWCRTTGANLVPLFSSGISWHFNETDFNVFAIASILAMTPLVSGIRWIRPDVLQLVVHPWVPFVQVPATWRLRRCNISLWASSLYRAEIPRARPFHLVDHAPLSRADPAFLLCPHHSAFTPVRSESSLSAVGLLSLPGVSARFAYLPLAVGTALYGCAIFADVPWVRMDRNSYARGAAGSSLAHPNGASASASRSLHFPPSDPRVRKLEEKELALGVHVVVSAQAMLPATVFRVHPRHAVIKPTTGDDGRLLAADVSPLRPVDDLSFQSSKAAENISVNHASVRRHLPRVQLTSVSAIAHHLQYLVRSRAAGVLIDPALCHSALSDDRVALKVDVNRAYRMMEVMAAHVWLTCSELQHSDGSSDIIADLCYPFGMKQATAVWTLVANTVNFSLQSQGVTSFAYSDDYMCVTSPAGCAEDVAHIVAALRWVGLSANADKLASEGAVGIVKIFLGVNVDVQHLTASLNPARCIKLLSIISDILTTQSTSATAIKSLARKLLFLCAVIPHTAAMTQPLFEYVSGAFDDSGRRSVLTVAVRHCLLWWQSHLPSFTGVVASFHPDMAPSMPADVCASDASKPGFGAISARFDSVFQDFWSALESVVSINHREAFVVLFAIILFASRYAKLKPVEYMCVRTLSAVSSAVAHTEILVSNISAEVPAQLSPSTAPSPSPPLAPCSLSALVMAEKAVTSIMGSFAASASNLLAYSVASLVLQSHSAKALLAPRVPTVLPFFPSAPATSSQSLSASVVAPIIAQTPHGFMSLDTGMALPMPSSSSSSSSPPSSVQSGNALLVAPSLASSNAFPVAHSSLQASSSSSSGASLVLQSLSAVSLLAPHVPTVLSLSPSASAPRASSQSLSALVVAPIVTQTQNEFLSLDTGMALPMPSSSSSSSSPPSSVQSGNALLVAPSLASSNAFPVAHSSLQASSSSSSGASLVLQSLSAVSLLAPHVPTVLSLSPSASAPRASSQSLSALVVAPIVTQTQNEFLSSHSAAALPMPASSSSSPLSLGRSVCAPAAMDVAALEGQLVALVAAAISPYFSASSLSASASASASASPTATIPCTLPPAPCVVFFCDNSATVGVFDRGTSSDPIFGFILHVVAQVVHQCRFQPMVLHIDGRHNRIGDFVSRHPFRDLPRGPLKLSLITLPTLLRNLLETALSTCCSHLPPTASQRREFEQRRIGSVNSVLSVLCPNSSRVLCLLPTLASLRTSASISRQYPVSVGASHLQQPPSAAMLPAFARSFLWKLAYITSATTSSPLSSADTARTQLLDIIASQLPRVSSCMC